MRNAFAQVVTELAPQNEKLILLAGDIGNRLFNDYKEIAPERFINCGIAEANMTGIAGGLAACGFRPITYTITPFNTLRCLEQIKIDLCLPRHPVIIVGTGSGLAYSGLGPTHHSCDDIAVMRALPNMSVVCPADPSEVKLAVREALQHHGPVFIRIGKKGEPDLLPEPRSFRIGAATVVAEGAGICIISTGSVLRETLPLASTCNATIVHMPTVKPLDEACLHQIATRHQHIVTVEEHSLIGGLGSAVGDWLHLHANDVRLTRLGIPDEFVTRIHTQDQAWDVFGLTTDKIEQAIDDADRHRL